MKTIQNLVRIGLACAILPAFVASLMSFKKTDDGLIKAAEMRTKGSLVAILPDFDFDAKCQVQSFTLYYIPKNQDAIVIENQGFAFNAEAQKAVKAATAGDQYQFHDITVRCPGDKAGRKVNTMAFVVK